MTEFMNLRFFKLLSENIITDDNLKELQITYREFVSIVYQDMEDKDSFKLYYELGVIRLELLDMYTDYSSRKKKKRLRIFN